MTNLTDEFTTDADRRYHQRILLAVGRAATEGIDQDTAWAIARILGVDVADAIEAWNDTQDGCGCSSCVSETYDLHVVIDGVDPNLIDQVREAFENVVNRYPWWCNQSVQYWWYILQLPGPAPLTQEYEVEITWLHPDGSLERRIHSQWLRPAVLNSQAMLEKQVRAYLQHHGYSPELIRKATNITLAPRHDGADVPF